MSLERDLQSKIAITNWTGMAADGLGVVGYSVVFDTIGFRDITAAIEPAFIPDHLDDVHIIVEDSPDGVTWTRVSERKVLPTRHYNANGQVVFLPVGYNPAGNFYLQTIGVTSAQRYVRFGMYYATIEKEVFAAYLNVVLQAENQQFDAYDPNGRPTDGMA